MFIVLLRFTDRRADAAGCLEGHKAWLAGGFDDGTFVLAGSLGDGAGGGIVAHGVDRARLEQRVAADPFVAEGIVRAEILEIRPARTDPRLQFLQG